MNVVILANMSPVWERSGRAAGVALGVDVDEVDVAAGLAVGGAKALRLVAAGAPYLC
jgi:hypothetical protein